MTVTETVIHLPQSSQPYPAVLLQGSKVTTTSYRSLPVDFLVEVMKNYLTRSEAAILTSTCHHFLTIALTKHLWRILSKIHNPILYARFESIIQQQIQDVSKHDLAWQRLYAINAINHQEQEVELPWRQILEIGTTHWLGNTCDCIEILSNGNIVTNGTVSKGIGAVWSSTGKLINILPQFIKNSCDINKIVALPNGNFVTSNANVPLNSTIQRPQDYAVRIWDPSGHLLVELKAHTAAPTGILLLPNGTIVTVAEDGFVCMWSLTGKLITKFIGHHGSINCIAALPNEGFVTGSLDRRAILWSDDGQPISTLTDHHAGPVTSIAVLPNGCIVTGTDTKNSTGGLWSPYGHRLKRFKSHIIDNIAIMPNGGFVTARGEEGYVWSDEGECLATLKGHNEYIHSTGTFPDGRIVTGSWDGTARIWSVTGNPLNTIQSNHREIWCVKVLPNGTIFTGGKDGKAVLWSADANILVQAKTPLNLFKKKNVENNQNQGCLIT